MDQQVEFEPATHEYRRSGRVYVSVTKAIQMAGLSPSFEGVDPFYAQRGTAVHKATEFDDKRTLDEAKLDEQIGPYLKAYRDWKALVKPEILAAERRFIHEGLEYAGTIDRIARIGGYLAIVDIKTGRSYAWHTIQTAAYAMAENSKSPQALYRFSLYLSAEGKFKFVEHRDHGDFLVWQSVLTIAKWKRRMGL